MDKTQTITRAAYALAIAFAVALGVQTVVPPEKASADVLCQNRKGKVKLRPACTGRWFPVEEEEPAEPVQGEQGERGPRGPEGPPGVVAFGSSSGLGPIPSDETRFLVPPATVNVESGEAVFVSSHRVFGNMTSGLTSLELAICYRHLGEEGLTAVGEPLTGISVGVGQRVPMGLSYVITGLDTDTYEVGLCGEETAGGIWTGGFDGSTSALVFLSLIHISEPTRHTSQSRIPSSS